MFNVYNAYILIYTAFVIEDNITDDKNAKIADFSLYFDFPFNSFWIIKYINIVTNMYIIILTITPGHCE